MSHDPTPRNMPDDEPPCDWHAVWDDFERAWQDGPPPLDEFLSRARDAASRWELVKLDLEFRWRRPHSPSSAAAANAVAANAVGNADTRVDDGPPVKRPGLPDRPLLEDYVACFPSFGPLDELPMDVIGEEYRVRRQWGDRPDPASYPRRFPAKVGDLRTLLDRIQGELAAESRRKPATQDATNVISPPGFEIVDELGRGGMGVVYRARQQSLGRTVALKVLLAGPHAGANELARFRTEVEAVARLQHPNIVQIHEVGAHDGRPYCVLEYVAGGNLAQYLHGAPIAANDAAKLIETLARAVHVAHQSGIVHRDLKPSNILLAFGGVLSAGVLSGVGDTPHPSPLTPHQHVEPKIADFGLAKRLDGDGGVTQSGAMLGSPSYMSPEQATGSVDEIGPATDVYALGAVLYEAICGRPPFQAPTPMETLALVREREVVPPRRLQPGLARDLETICLKCLEKSPARRYRGALALAEDLERFLQGRPVAARPVRPWERAAKWSRRRPAAAALLAVILIAASSLITGGLAYHARLRSAVATANEQRRRAGEGYREAFQAADRMLSEVGFGELAEVPGADPVRKRLLAEAVEFYRRFLVGGRDADPAVRRQAAEAQARLARIESALGDGAAAVRDAERTVELRKELARDVPDDPSLGVDLADSIHDLGLIYSGAGRRDECLAACREAIALLEPIAEESAATRASMASCCDDLAAALGVAQPDEAQRLRRRALDLRRRNFEDAPSNPEAAQALAELLANFGHLAVGTGRVDEAVPYYEEALEALRPQSEAHRPSRRCLYDLAECHKALGLLDTATRPDAAQHHLEQSLQFAEIVARRHPEVPSYQVSLAQTYNALAQFFTSRNQPDRALAAYREAVRLRGPLVEREPDNVYMAIGLAEALMNLSTVEDPVEGPTTAEATLRRALSVLGPFADQGPVVIELRRAAGGTWQNLASTLREQARLDEALEAHRRSIDLLDAAVLDAPHDATARALCLNAHGAAALTKGAAGLHAESLADWDRVVELADEAAAAKYRWMRAAAAAQAGEHARTMAEVNDLSRGATSDDQRYNVACLCSLASAAARSDCRLDDDERARLSDEYAQRAIQVLDGLREAGYFRDPAHAAALEADTDLAPLRQIAAFKALTTPSGKSPAE